jgi:hypothetical protein
MSLKLGSTVTLLASAMALSMASGCLDHPLKPVELEKGSEVEDQLQLAVNKDVDILFIIDNSGSMGEEQANLGANFPAFINVLEAEDVQANYRLGITTSDNGSIWCPAAVTTPEHGHMVMSSCKTRLNDFLFGANVDVRDLACNDICHLTEEELEILPSTTDVDPTPKPRPWLENIEGKKNIPATTDTAAAFACFGPQGVNGCGFENQLEGMYLALVRAQSSTEPEYGFLRSSAILAIIHVTDEADCSFVKAWESEVFGADGNKTFWADPADNFPNSAICWNAGVECEGDPSAYTTCRAVNKDVNGNVGVDDSNAVLHPMSRYIGLVQGIENEKQALNAHQEVIVALIGGVASNGEVYYYDSSNTNPDFQYEFGIGPGCEGPPPSPEYDPVQAVPPVRLRDMTDAFTTDNMFSICDENYAPALEAIAARIREQIQPACYTKCVKDTDASTDLVVPECTVQEDPPGSGPSVRVEECRRDANGYVIDPETNDYAMPGDNVNVCYAMLTDPGGLTSSPHDDMSTECLARSYNLEFKIARRPGFPAAGGTSISATCSLADFPELTCPGIGG